MPTLSSKGQVMPSSPIRKLVPFAETAKKNGTHVFHLNIGQPDIETPSQVIQKIQKIDRKVIEYSHSAGFQSYRIGLANYYQKLGFQLDPEKEIMITTGGSEALIFAFQCCFESGDEIIIPEPFYANYNGFATSCGIKVVSVTAKIENGFALPPTSELEAKVTAKTKGILICNPGNPTGYLYSKEEMISLKKIIQKHDLFLFADEVYREFCYDGNQHYSALKLSDIEKNVVLVDSISKRYSMCGARIGALISKNHQFMDMALKFAQARLSPPTLGQIAGEAALNTPKSYFEDVAQEYVQRRDIIVHGLNEIDGVTCPKPQGAFYAIAELPVNDADHFCQWILESFQYEGCTVMMAPASGFYANSKVKNQVRIAYILEKEHLKKAVICIEKALESYPNL